jgi:hypothetical protein
LLFRSSIKTHSFDDFRPCFYDDSNPVRPQVLLHQLPIPSIWTNVVLCLKKRLKLLPSGEKISIWVCRIAMISRDQVDQVSGPTKNITFKIDSGADYTILCIDHASAMGVSPDEIRTKGHAIKIRSGSGGLIHAYLFPVRARMEDDFGGWAE